MSGYSEEQTRTVAVTPMVMGSLSIICSLLIIATIVSDSKGFTKSVKQKFGLRIYDRIMYGLSVVDVINSLNLVLAPFMIPVGTPGAYLAAGNIITCRLHGFLVQFGFSVLFYNGSLSMYFLLIISGVTTLVKLEKFEIFFHILPLIAGLVLAIIGLALNLYQPSARRCWIYSNPYDCVENDEVDCINRHNSYAWRWFISGIWIFVVFVFMIVSNIIIYYKFRKIEEARGETLFIRSHFVAITARFYCLAYILTVIWTYIQVIYSNITGRSEFWMDFLIQFFYPAQGVFNYMIFTWRRQLGAYIIFCEWIDEEMSVMLQAFENSDNEGSGFEKKNASNLPLPSDLMHSSSYGPKENMEVDSQGHYRT